VQKTKFAHEKASNLNSPTTAQNLKHQVRHYRKVQKSKFDDQKQTAYIPQPRPKLQVPNRSHPKSAKNEI
jgi:hypothetical protein